MQSNPVPVKEDNIQKQIVQYCTVKKILFFAPINENTWGGIIRQTLIGLLGKMKGMQIAQKLIAKIVNRNKAMGQKKGVTDLVILLNRGKTVYVELKSKTGSLSPEQKVFGSEATKRGHIVYVARSLEDFIKIIEKESV